MACIDLHVHSNVSDGTLSPKELVDYAIEKQLKAFALTDHDSIDGLDEIINYAYGKSIEVIPGIELSTDYNGKDIHIVGLFIDYKNPHFLDQLRIFCDSRDLRNKKMADKLSEAGFPMTIDELTAYFPNAVLTRAHFARFMLDKGYIKSLKEAFDKYIGDKCPYFVPREKVTPQDGIRLILSAGGIPVLAHPVLYHMTEKELDHFVSTLTPHGLCAIEAIYSTYTPVDDALVRRIASKNNLLLSGGSDFHGDNKPGLDLGCGYGKLHVPYDILIKLKAAHESRKGYIYEKL